jgi:hypothetical protein
MKPTGPRFMWAIERLSMVQPETKMATPFSRFDALAWSDRGETSKKFITTAG